VSRTTYSRLFSAIGTTFGNGNGSTTFNLPDFRGEFIRAWDAGRGVDAGRTLGSGQGDAIRNIVGRTDNLVSFSSGAVTNTGALAGSVDSQAFVGRTGSNSAGYYRDVTFDASRVVPIASENRPRNIALAAFIFAGA
jgi:phage-related tail fiber protein